MLLGHLYIYTRPRSPSLLPNIVSKMSSEIHPVPVNEKSDAFQTEDGGAHVKDISGAIDAENQEHAMTVLQAVRAYPMACFWAFIMAFTIVRGNFWELISDVSRRLWNLTMSS